MLIDGQWCRAHEPGVEKLQLGKVFLGEIRQRGGESIYAKRWKAFLNGELLGESADKEYAQGLVECEIITRLTNIREAVRCIKARAPTSSDIYPDGAWARFKAARAAGQPYDGDGPAMRVIDGGGGTGGVGVD